VVVDRSNQIMTRLRATASRFPSLVRRLGDLPRHLTATVGAERVGLVHGDPESLAGWRLALEAMEPGDPLLRRQVGWRGRPTTATEVLDWFGRAEVDVFACTHTGLPYAQAIPDGGHRRLVVNNGAAGLGNFAGTTAAAKSPALLAYWAALNLLDAELLFSTTKVSTLLDPGVTPVRNIERHHLFPKQHLDSIGITGAARTNQIANMAFVDRADNAAISSKAPSRYWPEMSARLSGERLKTHRYWHALPVGWEQLSYEDFLDKRRRLIARVVRDAFQTLLPASTADATRVAAATSPPNSLPPANRSTSSSSQAPAGATRARPRTRSWSMSSSRPSPAS
jgi:hypothetical protein